MEKSVLALLVLLAVAGCVSGNKRAHGKSSPTPSEKTRILSHLGTRFRYPNNEVANLAISQPWNTSDVAQLPHLTTTENSHLEVSDRDGKEDETRRSDRRGHVERLPQQSKSIDIVRESGLRAPELETAREHLPQLELNGARNEERGENSFGTLPTLDQGSQLTCSMQSELGLVVFDTSCSVAAVASANCARLYTRDVEYNLTSQSPDVDFDFSSFDPRKHSAFHRNKRSKIGVLGWGPDGVSGGLHDTASYVGNRKAAVIVRVARSALAEDLTLWVSAPTRALRTADDTRQSTHGMNSKGGSPACWSIKFRPASGWSESLLRVQGLPVAGGLYSAWVVTEKRGAVVSHRSVLVTLSGDEQKSLKMQTVSHEEPAAGNPVLLPSQARKVAQDGEETLFFHSNEDDLEDLSTTSDPWEPPVVERPHLNGHLHPQRYTKNELLDGLEFFGQKSNGLNSFELLRLFLGGNTTNYSVTSRESFTDVNDISNPFLRDFVPRPHHMRLKRSLDCKECVKKLGLEHEYDAATAIFVLRLVFNCSTEGCCSKCNGTVNIQQYHDSISAVECSTLPISVQSFQLLYPVADPGFISVDSPYSIKLSTGCYLATVDIGEQAHYGFTWLRPHTEPPDLNAWNTTFYLEPQPRQRAVKVKWTQPQYPQNFSRYSLQLWYQADRPLNCSGYHTESSDMLQVQPTPSLPLDEPVGVFEDLSPGWYCARVTPLDPRCPRDGCAVRASHAVLLTNSSAPLPISTATENPPEETNSKVTIIAAVIGASLFVLIVTAVVAYIRFKWVGRARMSTAGPLYHKVSQSPSSPSERPCLLLVWTKRADSRGRHAAAVAALRRLLSTHFVVWDYLDLLSLPPLERDKVLENPAGWLYTAVHNPRVKVVLVSSAGAEQWRRAVQEGSCADTAAAAQTDAAVPLDVQLFPYLLQLLLHDPALVADYSKIFVVRFSKVTATEGRSTDEGSEAELGGLVQGLRYSLPSHLELLSSALLGASKKQQRGGIELPYPRTLFQEFEDACERLADFGTHLPSHSVAANCPETKLSNGSAKQHRTSDEQLC